MELVFHYTAWATLPAIVDSGLLLPRAGTGPDEAPLLWFSAHPKWEPTATKLLRTKQGLIRISFQEMVARFGAIRFGLPAVDRRLMDWQTACKFAGIPSAEKERMERLGRRLLANPAHWCAIAEPISIAGLAMHVWTGKWFSGEAAQMAEIWRSRRS